jgi:hypothetical protein
MTKPLAGGSRSYQPWSRGLGHNLVAILVSHHISWFTAPRMYSQRTLNSGHLELRTTTKTKLLNNESSRWIVQRNDALTPVYARPSTSLCYRGTTTKMFRNVSLWSVTWYWNGRLAKMASTSWQLHGKDHTSSRLLHDLLRTGLQDLTALMCPTPSISTSLGVFTPNSQIQICTFFLYYFCTLNYDIYIYTRL